MNNVSYKTLKANILKACYQRVPQMIDFGINLDLLSTYVQEQKLVPLIPTGEKARRVTPEIVPYLSEYFEKSYLSWFTDSKYYTVITFIDSESIDGTAQELIDRLATAQAEDPDDDKVKDIATLIANYPCYFATVVSYKMATDDTSTENVTPSYRIVCRANKVVIKSSDYQYNPKDFS